MVLGRLLGGLLLGQFKLLFALHWSERNGFFRAIQLHPTTAALYILAASHELEHRAPSAARTLMQRGIRFNKESVELWTEYVKLELDFVESLRRRWEVLGINEKGKGKETAVEGEEPEEDTGEEARAMIMQGEIVKSVLKSAVEGRVFLIFAIWLC